MTTTETVPAPVNEDGTLDPIIVDLGKQSRKRIKALKRGEGELMYEVDAALAQVRTSLGEAAHGKVIVPVVILYKKKRKRSGLGLPFGF